MSRSRPTTPIRRVSRGSISSHLRASTSNINTIATPLSFLTQAMSDLSYETSTLHSNLECLEEIDRALLTFDESFSMFLYGLRMNAFCVEWPEAPGEENFERAQERKKGRMDIAEQTAGRLKGRHSLSSLGDDTMLAGRAQAIADQTYMTADDDDADELVAGKSLSKSTSATMAKKPPLKSALKKTGIDSKPIISSTKGAPTAAPAKAKITLAEKKKREAKAAEIIDTMPLEYRSGDPVSAHSIKKTEVNSSLEFMNKQLGQMAKSVILALIASGDKGIRIAEIAKMPDMPQAKVNKCLIALAKHVTRRSDNGVVYQLNRALHG